MFFMFLFSKNKKIGTVVGDVKKELTENEVKFSFRECFVGRFFVTKDIKFVDFMKNFSFLKS